MQNNENTDGETEDKPLVQTISEIKIGDIYVSGKNIHPTWAINKILQNKKIKEYLQGFEVSKYKRALVDYAG